MDFLQFQCYILLPLPTKGTFTGEGKALYWGEGQHRGWGAFPPVYMLKKALSFSVSTYARTYEKRVVPKWNAAL